MNRTLLRDRLQLLSFLLGKIPFEGNRLGDMFFVTIDVLAILTILLEVTVYSTVASAISRFMP
ncbi:MAG: hypothetical protein P8Z42_09565 [Anaerolineales bacterium]